MAKIAIKSNPRVAVTMRLICITLRVMPGSSSTSFHKARMPRTCGTKTLVALPEDSNEKTILHGLGKL
jgi:hypothetical protein